MIATIDLGVYSKLYTGLNELIAALSALNSDMSVGGSMQIGQLAKKLAISTDTLRYYEKNQLLQASARTASGYRIYDQNSVKQLEFVLRAKSVGFTLN